MARPLLLRPWVGFLLGAASGLGASLSLGWLMSRPFAQEFGILMEVLSVPLLLTYMWLTSDLLATLWTQKSLKLKQRLLAAQIRRDNRRRQSLPSPSHPPSEMPLVRIPAGSHPLGPIPPPRTPPSQYPTSSESETHRE